MEQTGRMNTEHALLWLMGQDSNIPQPTYVSLQSFDFYYQQTSKQSQNQSSLEGLPDSQNY